MGLVDRSVSEVLQNIVRNVQEIVRSEIRLAKAEAREEDGKVKSAALLLSAGAAIALFATFFVLLASVYALSEVMPSWAAAALTGLVLAAAASMLLSSGFSQFQQIYPSLKSTNKTIKESVQWNKPQTK